MNFLDEVKSFCKKGKLKRVETRVQTPDGRELIESRDSEGVLSVRLCGGRGLGFVGDVKPDLQVAGVLPGLSLGSQDVAHEFGLLKRHGITHILNLATGVTNSFPGSFCYKRINILDLPDVNIRAVFDECFAFIDSAIGQGGHVFVHCNAGVSRSATVVIAYLMNRRKLTMTEAVAAVKCHRPAIRPNDGFVRQLQEYENELGYAI